MHNTTPDDLAEPAGRLLFAGEATSRHPATAHGAYESGLREAARLLELRRQAASTAPPATAATAPAAPAATAVPAAATVPAATPAPGAASIGGGGGGGGGAAGVGAGSFVNGLAPSGGGAVMNAQGR